MLTWGAVFLRDSLLSGSLRVATWVRVTGRPEALVWPARTWNFKTCEPGRVVCQDKHASSSKMYVSTTFSTQGRELGHYVLKKRLPEVRNGVGGDLQDER